MRTSRRPSHVDGHAATDGWLLLGSAPWILRGDKCEADSVLGQTAWRVLAGPEGTRVLKVCFNSPVANPAHVAPDGKEANVTFSCVESSPLAPLPK